MFFSNIKFHRHSSFILAMDWKAAIAAHVTSTCLLQNVVG